MEQRTLPFEQFLPQVRPISFPLSLTAEDRITRNACDGAFFDLPPPLLPVNYTVVPSTLTMLAVGEVNDLAPLLQGEGG